MRSANYVVSKDVAQSRQVSSPAEPLDAAAIEYPRYRTSCTDVVRMRFYGQRSHSHLQNAATLMPLRDS